MSEAATTRSSGRHWLLWLCAIAALAFLGYLFIVCNEIVRTASEEQIHPADAIVVFGAAEYSGRPSPVYRARLDHAFDLFMRGVAPVIITTGGAAADPSYSERGVGSKGSRHPAGKSSAQLHRGQRRLSYVSYSQAAAAREGAVVSSASARFTSAFGLAARGSCAARSVQLFTVESRH